MQQTRPTDFRPALEPVASSRLGRLTPATFSWLARLGELGLLTLCLGAVLLGKGIGAWPVAVGASWLLAAGATVLLWSWITRPMPGQMLGGYDPARAPARQALRLWGMILLILLPVSFAFSGRDGVLAAAAILVPASLATVLWRLALERVVPPMIRQGVLGLQLVIAGGGREAQDTLAKLAKLRRYGVHVIGLFDDRETARSPPVQQGVAKLGRISDIPAFLRDRKVDLIIVTMPRNAEARLAEILSLLWVQPVDIRLAPVQTSIIYRPRTYRWMGDLALLDLFDRPLRARDAALKRSFDLIIGVLLLLLLVPLMAVIGLCIRLDSSGPVFFRQAREGYSGRPFEVWKFRTLHQAQADPLGVVPVTAGDARVTRLGRVLRKTSLDELPQLFNVIVGTMSLVGPRPHAVGARSREVEFAGVVQGYAARHRVKPGITGLAQIRGLRGPVDTPEQIRRRVALDLDYIDRWSLLLDVEILLQTLPSVLRGENAV